jgi:hypothetical protein
LLQSVHPKKQEGSNSAATGERLTVAHLAPPHSNAAQVLSNPTL